MKIVQIIPGSGGTFYCQNCLRDNTLAKGMINAGHDVSMVPLYLPMFTDNPELVQNTPIFYGAISIYLKYKYPFLGRFANILKPLLNASPILRWVAKKSESVKANGLEGMTIAMLKGHEGPMADELNTLISWLKDEEKPDIIHISNPLLLGMAEKLKTSLQIPIVCSLQDEKQWLDRMRSPYKEEIWRIMSERSQFVDAFISVSDYYSQVIQKNMHIDAKKIHVVPIGMEFDDYESATTIEHPPTVGFLSKITEDLGFSSLVDAVLELKKKPELENLQLLATGGVTADEEHYVKQMQKRFADAGFADDIIIQRNFDRQSRIQFLQAITILSVPVPDGEAFGSYIIEALAAGIPVVQPNVGAYPELIEHTGGGVIYDINDPNALTSALNDLLVHPEKATDLGLKGQQVVLRDYSLSKMVENTLKVYDLCI